MRVFFRNTIALLGVLFICTYACISYAQPNVDSIKVFVNKLSSDSEKIKTLLDQAYTIDCDYADVKLGLAAEARQLAENKDWLQGMYFANRITGQVYFTCVKNYEKAFDFFNRNVVLAQKNDDKSNEAYALETIAKFHERLSDHLKTLEYYRKVIKLNPGIDIEIGVLGDMGVAYNSLSDYPHALESYQKALRMIDSVRSSKKSSDVQDTLVMAGLMLNIGDIYLVEQKPDKAYDNYKQVHNISLAISDKQFEIWSLTGIGKTYRFKKDYPNAIENYLKALAQCTAINAVVDEVKLQNELANTYLETWALDKATDYAQSALKIAEDHNYLELLSRSYAILGNICFKQQKFTIAIDYHLKALSIAQQTQILEDQEDIWKALSVAYEQNGQLDKALDALKHYHAVRDSVSNVEKAKELQRVQLESDYRETKKRDSLMTDVIYNKNLSTQQVYTFTGFAGLILVLLLTFFIYRNYETQKKYNELLSKEKKSHLAHIEAQSNVLSDIAYTQAHHIRGPISTILGLVQIFNYEDPADPMNKQVMEWISATTDKLDNVVKEVIAKENKLRKEDSE